MVRDLAKQLYHQNTKTAIGLRNKPLKRLKTKLSINPRLKSWAEFKSVILLQWNAYLLQIWNVYDILIVGILLSTDMECPRHSLRFKIKEQQPGRLSYTL